MALIYSHLPIIPFIMSRMFLSIMPPPTPPTSCSPWLLQNRALTPSLPRTAPSSSSFPSFHPCLPCWLHRLVYVSSSAASCPAWRILFSHLRTVALGLLQTPSGKL